jgi:hypothetical protein
MWFQRVSEAKTVKNRLHMDISARGGARSRSRPEGRWSTPKRSGL